MLKHDFFLAAMAAECFRRKDWVIDAFSKVRSEADDWKKDPYPYRIVQTPEGYFYVSPDGTGLHKILGTTLKDPPFSFMDKVFLPKDSVPNLTHPLMTTYGNLLVNYTVLIYPFGSKIKFITGEITVRNIESIIEPLLESDPEDLNDLDPSKIYVFEYLKFTDAMFSLAGFTQLCVPGASEKTMQAPPGIKALKDRLLKENAGRLHDPAVISKIDKELVDFDRAYMKGDVAEGFLNNKAYEVVRKKLFLMHGGESGFKDGPDMDLIPGTLEEGWDMDHFPAMTNSLREGSYNRGAMTALGGWAVKFFYRVMQNSSVSEKDCGTKLGIPRYIDEINAKGFVGFWVQEAKGSTLLTEENIKSFIGKTVIMRSPLFCKTGFTGYCELCMGLKNSQNPTGLGAAAAQVGSTFLYIYMGAMHGKALKVSKYDFKRSIA